MTCIVGIEQDGAVHIGGDSSATAVDANKGCDIIAFPKVFRAGPYLIGTCAGFRLRDILQVWLDPDKTRGPLEGDPRAHLIRHFIPAVRDALQQHGYLITDQGREVGGQILVGYRGQLFEVQTRFGLVRSASGFAAIGAGAAVALGSMYASTTLGGERGRMSGPDHITLALQAAERFCYAVRGPVNILTL